MKKTILLVLVLLGVGNHLVLAQNKASVTGAPFLRIAADARAAGMGDAGVATATDVFSQQWNAAKYPFSEDKFGMGISYTPYLTSLSKDIALLSANYFNKINDRSSFGIGLRYFGFGETVFRTNENDPGLAVNPNELALDGSYALKLSNNFAMAVTGRYLRSNLKLQEQMDNGNIANSFAFDLGAFYQSNEFTLKGIQGLWRGGINLSNVGPKLDYNDSNSSESALPSNLRAGAGFDFIFDVDNTLGTTLEVNKLLTKGINEFSTAVGLEYTYQKSFALRTGYFNNNDDFNNASYFTFGGGFAIKKLKFDLSYLASTSNHSSPLDSTLRFSLSYSVL